MSFSLIGGKKHKKSKKRTSHKVRRVYKGGMPTLTPASYGGAELQDGGRKKSTRKSSRKRRGGLARVAVPASLLALRKLLKGSLKRKLYSRKSRSYKTRGRK